MANEPKDPKVVSGGDVVFEDGNTQADSLDAVVQAAGTGGSSVAADWELENMNYLAGEWVKIMGRKFTPAAQGVLPYILEGRLETNSSGLKIARIIIGGVRAGIIRPFLEEEFGTELAQTGIYETTGLDSDKNEVHLAVLLSYFPEFNVVSKLKDCTLDLQRNPYQPLLAFPIEVRPFFTGAISEARYPYDNTSLANWHLPLTLKDVMAYAKKVNQLPKVKEYMDILNNVKGQR